MGANPLAKFFFSAYGILAVGAFVFALYAMTKDDRFYQVGVMIVVAFIVYMFVKLFLGRRR